jgi:uncharacterized membrane protein
MNSRVTQWIVPVLALAGLIVAAYLTYAHYEHSALVCGMGNCSLVQSSSYAKLAGIPIAILGLLMYAALLLLSLARMAWPNRAELTITLFGISLAGVIYAGFLTYVEIWVIDAICQWCVISAIITLVIFVCEAVRLLTTELQEP